MNEIGLQPSGLLATASFHAVASSPCITQQLLDPGNFCVIFDALAAV
jgi:hypothetical protein